MSERYRFGYEPGSVYASVMDLVTEVAPCGAEPGVVLDLGCGYGAIAEVCRERGYTYLGVDLASDGLASLAERGFRTAAVDLAEPAKAIGQLRELLGDDHLAVVTALDVIEHLARPRELLDLVHDLVGELAGERPPTPLVLSVPNTTHIDLGVKLLLGRHDVTPTGLLDATHLSLFSPERLARLTAAAGWAETRSADFLLTESDQHFPADLVALIPGTPLHDLLFRLRERSGPGVLTNQFVRAYLPTVASETTPESDSLDGTSAIGERFAAGPTGAGAAGAAPFLSVLLRTRGDRLVTLEDALLCLAAQRSRDFEVLILCHDVTDPGYVALVEVMSRLPAWLGERTRAIRVGGGGRARPLRVGVREARGRYFVALDDDDLVLSSWVEEFSRLFLRHPGQLLRAGCATHKLAIEPWGSLDGYRQIEATTCPFPLRFDLLDHIVENRTPICSVALPRSCVADLGLDFDERLGVREDWAMLLAAARYCGVASSPTITSIYRRWLDENDSWANHSDFEWETAHAAVIATLDTEPLLLPSGSASTIVARERAATALAGTVSELRSRITGLEAELAATRELEAARAGLERSVADLERSVADLAAQRDAAEADRLAAVARAEEAEVAAERERAAATAETALAHEARALAEVAIAVAERDAARVRDELTSSTSWRVTAPLRLLGRARLRLATLRR